MDTLVLKSKIIKRIAQIEDPAFLKAIQTIVDSKSDLFDILEYYHLRNGNGQFSKNLYKKIKKDVTLLIPHCIF